MFRDFYKIKFIWTVFKFAILYNYTFGCCIFTFSGRVHMLLSCLLLGLECLLSQFIASLA